MWIVGNVELEEEEEGTGRPGADPSTGHMQINSMNHFKFVKDDATGPVKFVKIADDGFFQSSKRKRRKRQEYSDGTTNVNRSNKFDVCNLTEHGLDV